MLAVASILVLGVAAQWLAWRLRLPSILLLLVVGFLAGPVTGFLRPDEIFGETLFPIVSLSVAVILLEGGLSLRFRDLRGTGTAVRNLILLGAPIAMVLTAACAVWVLDFELPLALLLGAILVVTGPTVIGPLLRHVRPRGKIGSVVMWEGIVNDPIGAILAVLVFRAMPTDAVGEATTTALVGGATAVLIGGGIGLVAAALLVVVLRRFWVPDYLQSPVALMIALGGFAVAESFQNESGLLTVTLMGILLANQRFVVLDHIVEFKENLRTLLISGLFILLSARVPAEELWSIDLRMVAFLVLLVVVVRPLTVVLSTLGTGLPKRDVAFLSLLAPRGIVAAAVASVFALELEAHGFPEPQRLASVVFLVIVGTVAVYGLLAAPLARWLGVSKRSPKGVLVVGAHEWARAIAAGLGQAGVEVVLVDTNRHHVRQAKLQGLDAHYGNVLSERLDEHVDLGEVGSLFALTSNDEANALAAMRFGPLFGSRNVYQLAADADDERSAGMPRGMHARVLFEAGLGFWELNARFREGWKVKATPLTDRFDFAAFREVHGAESIPLAAVDEAGRLRVFTAEDELDALPGETVVHLVREREEAEAPPEPASTPSGSAV